MDPFTERTPRVVSAVKLLRGAERKKARRFLAEGANSVTAALATGRAEELFFTEDAGDRHDELIARAAAAGVRISLITERAAKSLSDTVTPPGLFAVCALLDVSLADALGAPMQGRSAGSAPMQGRSAGSAPMQGRSAGSAPMQGRSAGSAPGPRLLAVPVSVSEPGNAGTVIRVADAVGADAAILAGDSVDPHNGKCVRSSAGSVFHLPIARERDVALVLEQISAAGVQILATAADGEVDLADADEMLARPTAWLFGNEAHGLDPVIAARADYRVRIPIYGRAESLNLATAAAICLYSSARVQHRQDRPTT